MKIKSIEIPYIKASITGTSLPFNRDQIIHTHVIEDKQYDALSKLQIWYIEED